MISKKSKREEISDVSDNESEAIHSAPSSSGGESENEINANDATPLPASVQSLTNLKAGRKIMMVLLSSVKRRVPSTKA
ncbi:hypothetical protein NPIL_640581 [Nephila pilipes]|uniref:Uncharacterized protein n=1 Tax=Nephila pilipes TaxID=299642 RepID=A0A8X6PN03_NEPPI|nr:hypothetical protein NPIL_640581 [Nephila pilipes]